MPCNTPILFAEANANRNTVFNIKSWSKEVLIGSYGDFVKEERTLMTSHSGGVKTLGEQLFSKCFTKSDNSQDINKSMLLVLNTLDRAAL